jgi:hypothetical protein
MNILIGNTFNVASTAICNAVGAYWPDSGIFTVTDDALSGVLTFGSIGTLNSSMNTQRNQLAVTNGTLWSPTATASYALNWASRVVPYDYAGLDTVYYDPQAAIFIGIYHGERWPGNGGTDGTGDQVFYGELAMAVSNDSGTWHDMGPIVKHNCPYSYYAGNGNTWPNGQPCMEITAGTLLMGNDGYLYCFNRDINTAGTVTSLAASRCLYSTVLAAAKATLAGTPTAPAFAKYYQGAWGQPGINGLCDELEPGNTTGPAIAPPSKVSTSMNWRSATYQVTSGLYLMACVDDALSNLYLKTSSDGINWSSRQFITNALVETGSANSILLYPSISPVNGTVKNGTVGQQFHIYFVVSPQGAVSSLWTDRYIARKTITTLS